MRKTTKSPGEKIVKDIKRAARKQYSSEEKIRIVLDGLRGEDNETLSAIDGVDGTRFLHRNVLRWMLSKTTNDGSHPWMILQRQGSIWPNLFSSYTA